MTELTFERVPQRKRGREVAEKEVRDGECQDERVAWVQPQLPVVEDDPE